MKMSQESSARKANWQIIYGFQSMVIIYKRPQDVFFEQAVEFAVNLVELFQKSVKFVLLRMERTLVLFCLRKPLVMIRVIAG